MKIISLQCTSVSQDLTNAAESASCLHLQELQRLGKMKRQAKSATITILSSAVSNLFWWCGSLFFAPPQKQQYMADFVQAWDMHLHWVHLTKAWVRWSHAVMPMQFRTYDWQFVNFLAGFATYILHSKVQRQCSLDAPNRSKSSKGLLCWIRQHIQVQQSFCTRSEAKQVFTP